MNLFHVSLAVCWILYAVVHSVMASVWFKKSMERLMGRYFVYYRLLYSCIAAVTLAGILAFQFSHASRQLFRPGWPLLVAGGLLALVGIAVMAACIGKYFMNLSGIDVLLKEKRAPVLEKGGVHRFVRHPLYSGTLLFIWSLFLMFPYLHNGIACTIITVYTLIGIHMEEKKLVLEFGNAYKAYARQTPMLIPFMPRLRRGHDNPL
jgi:protein-S-isoprenylcysteine O-methyltransferase Ste14